MATEDMQDTLNDWDDIESAAARALRESLARIDESIDSLAYLFGGDAAAIREAVQRHPSGDGAVLAAIARKRGRCEHRWCYSDDGHYDGCSTPDAD